MKPQWQPWVEERVDDVVALWFDVVQLVGVITMFHELLAERREIALLQ